MENQAQEALAGEEQVRALLICLAQAISRFWIHHKPQYGSAALHRYMQISPRTLRHMSMGGYHAAAGHVGTRHWLRVLDRIGLLDDILDSLENALLATYPGRELEQDYRRYPSPESDPVSRAADVLVHINNMLLRQGPCRKISSVADVLPISAAQASSFFNYGASDKLLGLRFRYLLAWWVFHGIDTGLDSLLNREDGQVRPMDQAIETYLETEQAGRAAYQHVLGTDIFPG